MTPTWFPWIIVGGFLFIALGLLGSKIKEKHYKKIQYFQDFISGSILIAFTGIAMPDLFPALTLPETLPTLLPTMEEDVVQVGPPRLFGR
jgi:hypothetical protein